jgi:hypothetical protein
VGCIVDDDDPAGARPGEGEGVRLRDRHDGIARAMDDRYR